MIQSIEQALSGFSMVPRDWFGPVSLAPFSFEENLFICLMMFILFAGMILMIDGARRIWEWWRERPVVRMKKEARG